MSLTSKDLKVRLHRRVRRQGITLTSQLTDLLVRYLELLFRWNERINLTSLENPDDAIDRLILEPFIAARFLPPATRSVIDIGSGGGSPAVPLKLAAPQLSLRMVEAKTRKAAFLREVVRELGLKNAVVEPHRYEELLARPDLHEAADLLTMRAVRLEGSVLKTLQAFVTPGGFVFLFRGPSGADVPAMLPPPLLWEATHPLVENLRSRLVVLRKTGVGPLFQTKR